MTYASVSCPVSSPWGRIQDKVELAHGMWQVYTASHGGIWLSPARMADVPKPMRDARFMQEGNWFEEDQDALIPIMLFPCDMYANQRDKIPGYFAKAFPELVQYLPESA
jgi:hypothetical protein